MFPYNSSSHEISTETNAFVQNSMEDVVVLGKTSPVGIREGRGSEHARYCDIEFVNSSTMVISVCHSEDAAASDFSTVLPSQSGELSLTSVSEACQSVASSPTKHPTSNHLIYRNNNTKVYRSKKEHNHHNNRPETIAVNRETAIATTTGRAGIVRVADAKITRPDVSACPDSSANNSKSMSKPLSDNKTSFSLLNSRVLSLSVNLRLLGGRERYVKGVPSLVRILKSDRPTRAALRPDSLDNYSLLGSCLHSGDNNNVKSNFSLLSNNNDNYKSVILLSSTSNHYFLCVEKDGGLIAIRLNCSHDYGRNHGLVFGSGSLLDNATRVFSTLGSGYRLSINSGTRKDVVSKNDTSERMMMMMMTTTMMIEEGRRKCRSRSRSTKLKGRRRCCVVCVVVSAGKRRRIQRWPWFRWPRWSGRFYAAGYNTIGYATSSSITLIVPRNEVIDQPPRSFPARIAPSKRAQSSPSRLHLVASELTQRACVPLSLASKQSKDSPSFKRCDDLSIIEVIIAEIVGGTCYKTSCTMISSNQDIEMSLYYCNNGISCTVATITVGALLFQDNCKSKALQGVHSSSRNPSKVDFKSVTSQSKSTISDMMMMYSFKEENGDRPGVMIAPGLAVYIPNMTTCKPTMTLTCQSASRTIGVPGSRADLLRPNYFEILRCDQIRTRRDILQGEDSLSGSLNVDPDHPDRRTTSTFINTRTRTEGCDRTVPIIELPQQVQFQSNHNLYLDHQSPFGLDYAYTCYYYHHLTTHQCDPRAAYPMLQPNPASYITRARDTLFQCARRLISIVCAQSKLADDHATTKLERTYFNSIQSLKRILAAVLYSRAADTTPRTKTPLQHHEDDYNKPIMDYKSRWGIATILRLAGGGESSLNSAGAGNWGSTQATAPNNNNINQSGWVANAGNPTGNSPASSNWSGNAVNRSVPGNTSQNQGQVPPGNQNIPGNASKSNNPNQPPNQQSGPPTSQSNNAAQGTQNNNQWAQANKSNGQTSQNPSVQNNNSGGVPQQQQQQQQQQQPPTASGNNNNQSNNSGQGSAISATTAAANPSTKQQLEQLNTMREALFSQDGWGCQHVNQDTNWDVPTSPEPSVTKDGAPMWNATVNNGTDLWEANLRNGGQPPPQQQQKTPWGHTPATNIGGTWGEDDDTADTSMWTGTPAPAQTNVGQWTGATGNQTGMWGGSNWADPRIDHRDPRELRSVDPREMRDPRDHRMSLDPREHIRVIDPMVRDPRMADMRGDPRGISGRLNGGNTDAMWGQPPGPPHHQMSHQHPSGPPTKMLNPSNINQWAAPPPKDIIPGKPSGWEEPSPPTQRRNVPNYDDGTSLWGNPAANQRTMPGSKVTHWKDPTPNLARAGMQCPPGMPQSRMPGQPGMKPDISGPMWGHPGGPGVAAATASGPGAGSGSTGRNGTWTEPPHEGSSWDEPKTATSWNDAQLNPATWSGPTGHKPKQMGPATNWADSDIDPTPTWGHPAKPPLSKEVIWNSREFRYLCDLGFKKEDVELALRNRDMNREEALELLSQLRPLDQWRRHDTHSNYDPTNQTTSAPAYPRFNHVAQQMSFPPGVGVPSGSASGSVGGSVASASLLKLQQQQQQQAAVPLQQQQPNTNAPQPPFNQPSSRAQQNQPNTQQLRMLVQQIQLAVQEGYLNHQILNQALAPQTLLLLNQLLQQIKVLQQLHQQHSVQNAMKGNSQSVLQISVQITKTKQQIANLQNQIAVQQATYMKQQQQQHPAPPSQSSDYYKSSVHDPMSALQNSFTDLTMNKEPPVSQQQSRLTQWKLPSLDKDGELVTEFSRAPGTTSKPGAHAVSHAGYPQSHNSSNMSHLLGQGDGTWSSRLTESGWPDPTNTDSTDGKDWQPAGAAAAFTDLVPEFEPGKPWKGTQMKSIEDDPSITPGSVVRSPLSLAAIKDPDAIFSSSSKTSPPAQQTNSDTSIPSLSNSTWTFNPPATTPSAFASSKNTWGESAPPPTAVTSELWGAPMSKVRGPPPGLGSKGASNASNGWAGLGTVGRSSSSWALQSGSNAGWVSTWLLLKNLTPQIDGSTLKTLCMQHGPVQDFRLYLNHGIALTKYSSRDEAIKAQGALNNCVLGNTTIFAESPADSEVHTLLQQLSHGGQQQGGGSSGGGWGLRPSTKNGPPPDTWGGSSSQLWGAPPSSNSLWSSAGIDSSEQQRATPSSLNSYLPGDLLGGESM